MGMDSYSRPDTWVLNNLKSFLANSVFGDSIFGDSVFGDSVWFKLSVAGLLLVTLQSHSLNAQEIPKFNSPPPQAQPLPQAATNPNQLQKSLPLKAQTIPQPAPVFKNPMELSPLSQYSDIGGITNGGILVGNSSVMSQINRLNGKTWGTNAGEALFMQRVDMSKTLGKYAELKNCSLNEAFAKATEFLRLAPRDVSKEESVGASAYYQIVDKDVLQITGPAKFFERLPAQLTCIENGIRHIEMEIVFVSVPAERKTDIRRWIVPGSYTAFNNKIPQATPFATQATYRNEATSDQDQTKANGTMVMATETVTKAYPTFMARFDGKGREGFLAYLKTNKHVQTTLSPTIRVTPGHSATISDGATRPFVVGVNRIEGDFTSAHQPIVQPIEEGTLLKVRAAGQDGKIRLDCDLALSTIEKVHTYAYDEMKSKDRSKDTVTVQVPEHRLKQVHLSTLVEEGKSIFIEAFGPTKMTRRLPKRPLAKEGKLVEQELRSMILLTPKWVEVDHVKTANLKVKRR